MTIGKQLLRMKGINKSFNKVQVLYDIDFTVSEGEVKGLIGENGAGKSTLMKILTGEYQKDSGTIEFLGEEVSIPNSRTALELGIAMVYQELNNAPDMTIWENMFIGRELKKFGLADKKEMKRRTVEYLKALDMDIDPNLRMGTLSVSEMQMVEIAKVVSYGSKIIVLDEPTSSITQSETEKLFEIVRKLQGMGIGIVYISHKLEELFELTDNITVLRDGHHIKTDKTGVLTQDDLIRMMVGREVDDIFPDKHEKFGDVLLKVENISRDKEFNNISFEVRAGEVLGFAGLVGAGRTETMMAIFGDSKLKEGTVYISGRETKIRHPKVAVAEKMALIPEDRKRHGLNLIGDIESNISMVVEKSDARGGLFVNKAKKKENGTKMIDSLNIKCNSASQQVLSLSGGNQQKIVLAKWLLSDADVFILDEPTRGIDIGAKIEIYKIINELASQGKAVILISSELNEIIGLSTRVIVMYEGNQVGELVGDEIEQEAIMSYAHNFKKEANK